MAITKERLEELIVQEKTIYYIKHGWKKAEKIELKRKDPKYKHKIYYKLAGLILIICHDNSYEDEFDYECEKLFETKAEAEFEAEYKHIPRTEYLDLPTFEELKNIKSYCVVSFIYKNSNRCELYKLNNNYIGVTCIEKGTLKHPLEDLELTYENYLEACELCKKLFIGEEV